MSSSGKLEVSKYYTAIDVKDKWTDWHIARNLEGQLFIYSGKASRIKAKAQIKLWTSTKELQLGIKWAGIKYRVRVFKGF